MCADSFASWSHTVTTEMAAAPLPNAQVVATSHRAGRLRLSCGPSKAGSKISAQIKVQISEIIRIFPMLDVPGWRDSHTEPKAVPVARALNSTPRARLE